MADASWYANNVAVVSVVISAVALVVSVLSVRYTRRQTKAVERQASASEDTARLQAGALKAQAENTAEALKVAERSAKAAEDSASSTKALVEIGQRPWVSLEDFEVLETQAGDLGSMTVMIHFALRNRGLTAALDVRTEYKFEQYALPIGEGPLVAVPGGPSMTLGPAGSRRIGPLAVVVRNEPDATEIRRGQRKVLLYGECGYADVFGESHRTQWCFEYHLGIKKFSAFKSELNLMT